MKIRDVLANEMMNLNGRILPPCVKLFAVSGAPIGGGCQVTNRSVKPNVPIITGTVRNFKTKIGCWSRDVPVPQWLAQKVALQVICHFRLYVIPLLNPLAEKRSQRLQLHEQMIGASQFGLRSGKRHEGVDQYT